MIKVEICPDAIDVNQASDIVFRLVNTSPRVFTSVSLTLIVPSQLLVLRGDQRILVDRLLGDQSYEHAIRLKARKPGEFQLQATTFSFRAPDGEITQMSDIPLTLTVHPVGADTVYPEDSTLNSSADSQTDYGQTDLDSTRRQAFPRITTVDGQRTLTAGERERLEAEWARLQDRYDTASRRINALDSAIDRTLDTEHRQILEERRLDWVSRRERITIELTRIEQRLGK